MTTLWLRSAAIAVCRAKSTFPAGGRKASTRYDNPTDGPTCERCDNTPLGASGRAVLALTSTVTVGRKAPRLAPKTSAAARACAHDNRVAGLFRSARSTTSGTLSRPSAAGIAAVIIVASRSRALCSRAASLADGVQYSLGWLGAPGTPLMAGGRWTHPAASRRPPNRVRIFIVCSRPGWWRATTYARRHRQGGAAGALQAEPAPRRQGAPPAPPRECRRRPAPTRGPSHRGGSRAVRSS